MKNTIRIISIIAFIAIMGISLTNCEEPNYPAELCYKWYASQVIADNPEVGVPPSLEFKSNGDYFVLASIKTGTYTASGDTITLNLAGLGLVKGTVKYKTSGTTLTISDISVAATLPLVTAGTYYRKK